MSLAPPDLLRFAYLSLKGNPVRSLLSTLGVFMGVLAVSATLEARNLGQAYLFQQLSQREAPRVSILPAWDPNATEPFRLRLEDMYSLRQQLTGWQAVSAARWGSWNGTVLFEGKEAPADLDPVSMDYLATSGRRLLDGRFFSTADVENYRAVAVIDEWLEDELFETAGGVGNQIFIDGNSFNVIGVVNSLEDQWSSEPRGLIMISLAMDTAITGRDTISRILIRPKDIDDIDAIGDRAVQILQQTHVGQDFRHWSNIYDINEQRKTLRTVSIILLVLGGIALTVGGVGIANITIAATVERTSEIGLRRAIGATQREILVQFVLEAVIISCLGGAVAIATTQSIAIIVARTFELPYTINAGTSLIALGSAAAVGVGSSFFPALQASRLDPVNALRS